MLKPGRTDTCCKGVFTSGVSEKTQTGLVWFIQPDEDTDIKKQCQQQSWSRRQSDFKI